MSAADRLTSIGVHRDQLHELRQIALDLSRAEGRRVTLAEVVTRMLAAWHGKGDLSQGDE